MKKIIITLCLIFTGFFSYSRIISAKLQVAGLTCSMCSRSTLTKLESIDFISEIETDLDNNLFLLTFKKNADVDPDIIREKVEAAGFSIQSLKLELEIDHLSVKSDEHIRLYGRLYHFMNVDNQNVSGLITVRILDKGFVTKKEYKSLLKSTAYKCFLTGYTSVCCTNSKDAERIYHVTVPK